MVLHVRSFSSFAGWFAWRPLRWRLVDSINRNSADWSGIPLLRLRQFIEFECFQHADKRLIVKLLDDVSLHIRPPDKHSTLLRRLGVAIDCVKLVRRFNLINSCLEMV